MEKSTSLSAYHEVPVFMDIETNSDTKEPEEIAFYMPTRKEGHREFSVKIPGQKTVTEVFLQAINHEASSIASKVDDIEFFVRLRGKEKIEFSATLVHGVLKQFLSEVFGEKITPSSEVWRSKITSFKSKEIGGKHEFNAEMIRAAVYHEIFSRAKRNR